MQRENFEVVPEWVHIKFVETSQFTEVYGFSGSQGSVNLEGVRYIPKGRPSKTLIIFMHPATTLQLLPVPRPLAARGAHVLCAGSRYQRNDTPLIMEKVLLDLGAYIRHAREVWGYEKIVIDGWSGGGALSLFYQSQAENPTITQTPAGDPTDIKAAKLIPANGLMFHAAHLARSITLCDWLDPSVIDEDNPDRRVLELDIYDPANPNQPHLCATPFMHAATAAAGVDASNVAAGHVVLLPEDQVVQSMPDASPTRWHLAHTTWFFETFVLRPYAGGYRVFDSAYEYLFNSYYNALGEQFPRPQRGMVTRPGVDEIRAYRAHVDERMRALLAGGTLPVEVLDLVGRNA